MESQYSPTGWLGILIGEKFYFDFSGKYPFEEKMNRLLWEIKGQLDTETSQTYKSCSIISSDVYVSDQMTKKENLEKSHLKDHKNVKTFSRRVTKTGKI